MHRPTFVLVLSLLLCSDLSAKAWSRYPDQPDVLTLAGSGALGMQDGLPGVATFVAPVGLHFAADGTLYVADRGAQRIRRVARDGSVTTLAGSGPMLPVGLGVAGGFLNGAANTARFNDPEDVAPFANGGVLVADAGNGCIRIVAASEVQTFAGKCGDSGNVDGKLESARFVRPHSLAVAPDGDVYVVDAPNGIRRISHNSVTTLSTPHGSDAIAITFTGDPRPTLVVTCATLIDLIDPTTGSVRTEFSLDSSPITGAQRAGMIRAGPATGVAAFDAHDLVITDPLDSSVFFVQFEAVAGRGGSYVRLLGADPSLESLVESNSVRDGDEATARFSEPSAAALAPDGRVAVADLGSRRIRILSAFDRDTYVSRVNAGTELPTRPDPSVIRVAVIGNSYIWTLQGWDDSIAGEFQRYVNEALPKSSKRVEVYPIMRPGTSTLELLTIANEELADGLVDDVIVDVADRAQFPTRAGAPVTGFDPGWIERTREALADTRRRLAAGGVGFFAMLHPGVDDFQDEASYLHVDKSALVNRPLETPLQNPAQADQNRSDVLAATAVPGLSIIDCWPAMLSDHASADRQTLFMAWDAHFAPHARTVIAREMAQAFVKAMTSPHLASP